MFGNEVEHGIISLSVKFRLIFKFIGSLGILSEKNMNIKQQLAHLTRLFTRST